MINGFVKIVKLFRSYFVYKIFFCLVFFVLLSGITLAQFRVKANFIMVETWLESYAGMLFVLAQLITVLSFLRLGGAWRATQLLPRPTNFFHYVLPAYLYHLLLIVIVASIHWSQWSWHTLLEQKMNVVTQMVLALYFLLDYLLIYPVRRGLLLHSWGQGLLFYSCLVVLHFSVIVTVFFTSFVPLSFFVLHLGLFLLFLHYQICWANYILYTVLAFTFAPFASAILMTVGERPALFVVSLFLLPLWLYFRQRTAHRLSDFRRLN